MLNSIVTLICIALIAFILFWFFKKPEKSGQKAQQKKGYQEIQVEVMGGYTPELIILKKSVPARIVFDRKDPSPCLDQIVFPDFGVHADLPMGEIRTSGKTVRFCFSVANGAQLAFLWKASKQ